MHHELAPDGGRVLTDKGTLEIGDLKTIMNPPPVYYFPDQPDDARLMQESQRRLVEISVDNPVFGLYSPTDADTQRELGQLVTDRINAMIVGRAPITDLDALIQEWRGRGGDRIRTEYQEALEQRGS